MQFIYPIGTGSTKNDLELRYSLRSVATHHPQAKVTIVGYLPNWCKNVHHIKAQDNPNRMSGQNTYVKMLAAMMHLKVNEHYVHMNDDFVLLKPHPDKGVNYWVYNMKRALEVYNGGYSHLMLKATSRLLIPEAINYECHAPQSFISHRFGSILSKYNHMLRYTPLAYNTLYINEKNDFDKIKLSMNLKFHKAPKDWNEATADLPAFSYSDSSWGKPLKNYLDKLFPKPCKFER